MCSAQYMAENGDLIEAAYERMNLGRLHESLQYQTQLQQNLIYLATHADEQPGLMPLKLRQDHSERAADIAQTAEEPPEAVRSGEPGD